MLQLGRNGCTQNMASSKAIRQVLRVDWCIPGSWVRQNKVCKLVLSTLGNKARDENSQQFIRVLCLYIWPTRPFYVAPLHSMFLLVAFRQNIRGCVLIGTRPETRIGFPRGTPKEDPHLAQGLGSVSPGDLDSLSSSPVARLPACLLMRGWLVGCNPT